MMNHVIAISGGKDSTAMALRLAEVEPRDYTYLITPTGDELPPMIEHWQRLERMLGKPLVQVQDKTLHELIQIQNCLPNNKMRWCTRMLKIEPAIRYYRDHSPCVAYVGLRADEPADERRGIFGEEIVQDYPLRRWGWTESDVWDYLHERGVSIPPRTDCARCYDQRLSQWRSLWRNYPKIYADAEEQEAATGHTFRNPKRDTWPAGLANLRAEFERGRIPRGDSDQMNLWDSPELRACRVCSL